MKMNKKIEQFINNYDMYCESENEHHEYGRANNLAEVLLGNHVKSDTVLKILQEFFGENGQDCEEE
jgi:hypothetical protein